MRSAGSRRPPQARSRCTRASSRVARSRRGTRGSTSSSPARSVTGIVESPKVRRALAMAATAASVALAAMAEPASAGTLWYQAGGSWNSDCSAFSQVGGDANSDYTWTNQCGIGGGLGVYGFPYATTANGSRAGCEITAPAGITINSAWIPCGDLAVTNVNNGQGWGGGDYYAGGGSSFTSGQTCHSSPSFNSSYYGFQLVCGGCH